jgi:signal transduction histidine kinase/CheY-like chemotaxis protein
MLYGLAGLGIASAMTVIAATETMRRTVERDAMAQVDRNMLVAWHLLRELGSPARLADGRLLEGDTPLDGNLALVDDIQRMVGGFATVFKGDVRVATNILDRNGKRGIGTHLASQPAREAVLRDHRPFRGVVDVLGERYYSGYDPITDSAGDVIGILYVGQKESDILATITRMREAILGVAFACVLVVGLTFRMFAGRLINQLAARERSLAETNAHLDTALATMGNGLCLWDAQDRLVLANARLCTLLGLPAAEIVPGLTFRRYIELRHAAGNFGPAAVEDVYSERLALLRRRQAASHVDVSLSGRAISVLHRPIAAGGWVATYEDITDQREAERARAAAEAELLRARERVAEEASRAKSGFLAMMSHEIRTPMNAVLGLASSLLASRLPPEQHAIAQAIHDSGDVLLRLLNDILDFSKLDAGRMTFEDAPFSPAVLTHNVVSGLGPHAAAKGLRITAECDAALPPGLVGDAGRVRQILLNLAANAVKFTVTGGVTVRADCVARDGPTATVRWSVSDTGIGIPADRLGSLFNEFVQVDNSITRRFGGTGLGLAISKRLVAEMGGTITVDSKLSEGTTFRVELTLPASEERLEAAREQADPVPAFEAMLRARGQRLRILFAEDNPTNQMVARQLLKHLDVQVDVVGDGHEAVEAAIRFAYDIIFMDMHMPELDGLDATRAIRRQGGRLASLPIIALTANAFQEDVRACLEAGMTSFLPKPVNRQMLLASMHRALTDTTDEDRFASDVAVAAGRPQAPADGQRLL